ncbi:T9SS type A sorting domain-containing protein [Flavobacterium pedocola]
MRTYLYQLTLLLFSVNTFSQAPALQWQKALGGMGNEYAHCIVEAAAGEYVMAGYTYSNNGDVSGNHGDADAWVVKVNATGAIVWQKTLGGSGEDWAKRIRKTPDGGFILTGRTASTNGDVTGYHGGFSWDCWVVKLNADGTIQWQKALGGGSDDQGYDIQPTSDGGYIVTCGTHSNDGDLTVNHGGLDIWVVKLNATGAIEWQKALGGTDDDLGGSIQQTADGGYILASNTNSNNGDVSGNHGNTDIWLVKLDSGGTITWQKTLGGGSSDAVQHLEKTTDGNYIVCGYTFSNNGDVSGNHGNYDAWVVKLNAVGTILWQKTLGGVNADQAKYIQQTPDGGFIVVANSKSTNGDVTQNQGDWDYWVVRLDELGTIQWQKTLGGSSYDEASCIEKTTDGGYILTGRTNSYNGDVTGNHGNDDFWVVKLATDNLSTSEFDGIQTILYPNPASNFIKVTTANTASNFSFKIFDVTGKIVLNGLSKFDSPITIERLANGMYLLQMETENGVRTTAKFIKN